MKSASLGAAALIFLLWGLSLYYTPVRARSTSMTPTIQPGDWLIVRRTESLPGTLRYLERRQLAGAVVVLVPPEGSRMLAKRVVGVAGDVLEQRPEALLVNGDSVSVLSSPTSPQSYTWGPVEIPEAGDTFRSAEHSNTPLAITFYDVRKGILPDTSLDHNYYYVLGDNLEASIDSRSLGLIREDNIRGIVVGVVRPTMILTGSWSRVFSVL